MEILIGLLIITLFGAITYINLKEQENLRKENELLKGQQLQYRRVLYENNLIPKEFIGDRND